MKEMLNTIWYNNTIEAWLIAVGVGVLAFIAQKLLLRIVRGRMKTLAARTATDIDDLVIDILGQTKFFVFLTVSLYIGSRYLELKPLVDKIIESATIIAVYLQVALWSSRIITYALGKYVSAKGETSDESAKTYTGVINFISRLVVWTIILLFILDNLGINVTALVTGLGIGGIAVALALQNILSDLFASLSIIVDKPFSVGDTIIVDTFVGTVEHVGLKSTRMRSLSGEQLIFSNNDLLKSRIRNMKRMEERRILFTIGVVYRTPYEKVRAIPDMIRAIIEAEEMTRFDRAHFKEFGASALLFEIVYFVLSPEFTDYMDVQQRINLAIHRTFEEEDIEFAYPTQTLFIEKAS